MRVRGLVVASIFAVVLAPGLAAAQPSTGEGPTDPGAHRLVFELDFFHDGSASVAALAPGLYGRFRLVDDRHGLDGETGAGGFVLDLDVAWRGIGLAGDASTFRMGNPYVGARLGYDSGPLTVRGGAGVTLPLTNVYDDDLIELSAYLIGFGLHGAWDTHLIFPQSMALVVRADAEYRTDIFLLGTDAALIPLFDVPSDDRDAMDAAVLLQLGVYAAVIPIPALAAGLRFQMVGSFGRGNDEGFLALVPFVRAHFDPAFAELRLHMNLDEPYGFAFDEGRIWAISLSVGGNF